MATSEKYLLTKFEIPQLTRRNLARKRLTRLLSNSQDARLIMVVAPTGYGKTSLLSEWISSTRDDNTKTVWLSLDETDNNPSRFWAMISKGLRIVFDNIQFSNDQVYFENTDQMDVVYLISLINEISQISCSINLLLDDYQWITNEQIHQGLSFLIDHQPANIKIIISSQNTPPLPLSRFRMRGYLIEITSKDMVFSKLEMLTYLNEQMKVSLDEERADDLYQYTEGWIAGLQLIGLSLQNSSDIYPLINQKNVRQNEIYDYLTDEVINHLDPEIQEFLIKTSILSELSVPLCNYLLDRTDSEKYLSKLETSNLFIETITQDNHWLRYHTFFAEIIQIYLVKRYPDQIDDLHRKAAKWYYENGYPEKAVSHAMAIHDLELAASILDSCSTLAVNSFDIFRLLQWTNFFTEDIIRKRPKLGLFCALAFIQTLQFTRLDATLNMLSSIIHEPQSLLSAEEKYSLQWNMDAIRASMNCSGVNLHEGIKAANELRNRPPSDETYFGGQMLFFLAFAYVESGDYESALKCCQEAKEHALKENVHAELVFTETCRGYIYQKQGRLLEATDIYQELQQYCKKNPVDKILSLYVDLCLIGTAIEQDDSSWIDKLGVSFDENISPNNVKSIFWIGADLFYILLAKYFYYKNNLQKAFYYFREAKTNYLKLHRGMVLIPSELINLQTRIWRGTGQIFSDLPWIENQLQQLRFSSDIKPEESLAWSKVFLAQGEFDKTISSLKSIDIKENESKEQVLDISIQNALAASLKNNRESSFCYLKQALQVAQPVGYRYRFIEEGQPMLDLLEKYKEKIQISLKSQKDIAQLNFINDLISRIKIKIANNGGMLNRPTNYPYKIHEGEEQLSVREVEILNLLIQTKSPKEISDELHISINTTKVHIKNIYRKLDAHSRISLYQKAMDLGLI